MFWKKKKDKSAGSGLEISFDPGVRNYFRVTPSPSAPVYLRIGTQRFPVIDISAGGMAIPPGRFTSGTRFSATLHLPQGRPPIPTVVDVVKVVQGKMAALEFAKIKDEDREMLHQYVLKRQKEQIEHQRSQEPDQDPDQSPES